MKHACPFASNRGEGGHCDIDTARHFDYRIYESPTARRSAPIPPEDFARLAGAEAPSDSSAIAPPTPDSITLDGPVPAPLSPQILMTLFQFQDKVGPEESEEQADP